MQTFPIAAYAVAMNTMSRTGGGGSGGGDDEEDEFLTFLKWFNYIMIGLLMIMMLFMGRSCWNNHVVHRESFKIELVVTNTEAERTSGKHKRDYWLVTLEDAKDQEYTHTFPRHGTEEVYKTDVKFTTTIVWHTSRDGDKQYFFPDIDNDIPTIE